MSPEQVAQNMTDAINLLIAQRTDYMRAHDLPVHAHKSFDEVHAKVVDWADARNLVNGSSSMAQMLKTMSEVGELADAIAKGNYKEIVDGIGDVMVTLIIIAEQNGVTVTECLAYAYDEIKDRRGRMVNGVFVKES